MKDESKKMLVSLGFGNRRRYEECLAKKVEEEAEAKRRIARASAVAATHRDDDAEDAKMPPPKPQADLMCKMMPKRSSTSNWIVQDSEHDVSRLLDELESLDSELSDWERDFYEDVKKFFEDKGGLTVKQYEKLIEVVDRH